MFSEPERIVARLGLGPGMTVADFGSGSGAYALALARQVGDHGRVYAVEVQKNLLERLANEAREQKLPALQVVWGNLEKVGGSKLAEATVDLVLLANVLFQSHARYAIFLEAKRILRPPGRLVVVEWSDSFGGLGPAAEAVVLPEETKKIASEAGLELIGELPAGEHHYGLIFTKKPSVARA